MTYSPAIQRVLDKWTGFEEELDAEGEPVMRQKIVNGAEQMECRLDSNKHRAKLPRPTRAECVEKIERCLGRIIRYLETEEEELEDENEYEASENRDHANDEAADLCNWVLLILEQDVNVEA